MKESSQKSVRYTEVAPASPVAGYIGGKRNLAKIIIPKLEAIAHETYVEPFIGMGGIFLRRGTAPKTEVINDINREVVTLFRVLQRHYPYFLDYLKFHVTSRAEFERLRRVDPDTLTDLERAGRFLYLQRLAFSGTVWGSFAVHPGVAAKFNILNLATTLEAAHQRLAGVTIECLPWEACIRRWDRPTTLFYLDPPYWDCEDYYGNGIFSRDDFARLAEVLSGIKGRFVMSLNDTPGVRKTFKAFAIEAVDVVYTAHKGDKKKAGEVLISGPKRR